MTKQRGSNGSFRTHEIHLRVRCPGSSFKVTVRTAQRNSSACWRLSISNAEGARWFDESGASRDDIGEISIFIDIEKDLARTWSDDKADIGWNHAAAKHERHGSEIPIGGVCATPNAYLIHFYV